jgi:hypothetical protein
VHYQAINEQETFLQTGLSKSLSTRRRAMAKESETSHKDYEAKADYTIMNSWTDTVDAYSPSILIPISNPLYEAKRQVYVKSAYDNNPFPKEIIYYHCIQKLVFSIDDCWCDMLLK